MTQAVLSSSRLKEKADLLAAFFRPRVGHESLEVNMAVGQNPGWPPVNIPIQPLK